MSQGVINRLPPSEPEVMVQQGVQLAAGTPSQPARSTAPVARELPQAAPSTPLRQPVLYESSQKASETPLPKVSHEEVLHLARERLEKLPIRRVLKLAGEGLDDLPFQTLLQIARENLDNLPFKEIMQLASERADEIKVSATIFVTFGSLLTVVQGQNETPEAGARGDASYHQAVPSSQQAVPSSQQTMVIKSEGGMSQTVEELPQLSLPIKREGEDMLRSEPSKSRRVDKGKDIIDLTED